MSSLPKIQNGKKQTVAQINRAMKTNLRINSFSNSRLYEEDLSLFDFKMKLSQSFKKKVNRLKIATQIKKVS